MAHTHTEHDTSVAPELEGLHLEDRPDGPGAAAMISAGIGVFFLGFLTVLSEASPGIHDFLGAFSGDAGVGPLAGKTILAVIAYLGSWAILHVSWKAKDVDLKRAFWIGLVLGVLGALGTFPPVFLLWH